MADGCVSVIRALAVVVILARSRSTLRDCRHGAAAARSSPQSAFFVLMCMWVQSLDSRGLARSQRGGCGESRGGAKGGVKDGTCGGCGGEEG